MNSNRVTLLFVLSCMENFKLKLKEFCDKSIIKSKELYNFLLAKCNGKPYILAIIWGVLLLLIILIFVLIFSWKKEEPAIIEEPVEIVEEIPENPPLSDSEKIDLCSKEANKQLRSAYDFKWEIWTTTNFSANEESHQLKWVAYLLNEDSVLAQCNIESGRFRDTEVRVGFLPEEYYSYEKFQQYQKYCEDLWWKLKSRWWYGHWMNWTCWFDDWSSCDLREFFRWNCKK